MPPSPPFRKHARMKLPDMVPHTVSPPPPRPTPVRPPRCCHVVSVTASWAPPLLCRSGPFFPQAFFPCDTACLGIMQSASGGRWGAGAHPYLRLRPCREGGGTSEALSLRLDKGGRQLSCLAACQRPRCHPRGGQGPGEGAPQFLPRNERRILGRRGFWGSQLGT